VAYEWWWWLIMAENPHFAIPFRLNGYKGAFVTEQDSEEEIQDCVEVIVRYTEGQRPEKPEFGIPDITFSMPSPDVTHIRRSILAWEPRTTMDVGKAIFDRIDPMIQRIRVEEERPPNE
jgi:phage baseplate assembly protein W